MAVYSFGINIQVSCVESALLLSEGVLRTMTRLLFQQ